MRRKRAIIFEHDDIVLDFMTDLLSLKDYEVLAFKEPDICPIYGEDLERCENANPCADILITDIIMPRISGIELLQKQAQRGCMLDSRNKAVISDNFSKEDTKIVEKVGCRLIEKPFRVSAISEWIEECEKRIDLTQPLGIKRRETRRPANIKISYYLPSHDTVHRGVVTNISPCGFCIVTRNPLVKDEIVDVITDLSNFCTTATVRWVSVQDDSSLMAGLCCC